MVGTVAVGWKKKKRKRRENIKYLTHRMQITSKTSSLDHDFFGAIGYIIKTPFFYFSQLRFVSMCVRTCACDRAGVSVCMCMCVPSLVFNLPERDNVSRVEKRREHRVHFRRVYYNASKVPVYAERRCMHIQVGTATIFDGRSTRHLFTKQFMSLLFNFVDLLIYPASAEPYNRMLLNVY